MIWQNTNKLTKHQKNLKQRENSSHFESFCVEEVVLILAFFVTHIEKRMSVSCDIEQLEIIQGAALS